MHAATRSRNASTDTNIAAIYPYACKYHSSVAFTTRSSVIDAEYRIV